MPSLSFHFWPSRKPGMPFSTRKELRLARAGRGVDDEGVAERVLVDAAVGDEGLDAVEHVDVAVAPRARAHGEHVGADARARSCTCRRSTRPTPRAAARACCCTSLPFTFTFCAKSTACASTASAKPGSEVESASQSCTAAMASRPAPPYSSGERDAEQPELAGAAEEREVEASRRGRAAAACGSTSRATNSRSVCREQRVLGGGREEIEASRLALGHVESLRSGRKRSAQRGEAERRRCAPAMPAP